MPIQHNHLVFIDESNKNMMRELKDPNMVFYAELKEWYATDAFQSFSIKYVLDGHITYRNGAVFHTVKPNQVLVGNKQPNVSSYFESRQFVKSFCVNLDLKAMSEVHALLSKKNDPDPDQGLGDDPLLPGFHERIYTMAYNHFLAPLHHLARILETNNHALELNEEFFLDFSEKIAVQLFQDCKIYDNLDFSRSSTKKEIIRRLDIARNFLQENYLQRPTVKELAKICNMSEFHFFRAFRQAFKISPYQFQLKLRLENARELTTNSAISFTEISKKCSFPDLPTFSKAFKRMYRISPSAMRESLMR
jgi:AraC family transcriptional regulator